ncbi:DUF397 domain-containing protein [Streptomyces millisiae]|uniref:DUF397 domain-containing protein n=1 Tax=Streptomyces millisiae TaxID=3075542 RepID=A0ABU2LXY4_9ACTN|nr:DUF397 domain-containing protein [Streptomyces sp. DSM 44918]MDT0322466.1 DUF397 domain-containing protein [Streptomyces sp. DSM 44918]
MRCRSIPDASAIPAWRKSSYSGGDGGDCVEVAESAWRRSSYSLGDNGNCLEVVDGFPGAVPVRDSKNPTGPALLVPSGSWAGFVAAVRAGSF